jgi:NTP pyrophosphatase (non-canonical NTP hydrolase)
MNNQINEVMDILQEECAEVVQAVSKCRRFGLDNSKPNKPKTNRQHLAEELGDLQAMIKLAQEFGIVDKEEVAEATKAKIEKLKVWSNIFNDQI